MSMHNRLDYEQLGREVEAYCKKYNIRIEDFFSILNDQKVIPMLRGKAAEYDAVFILQRYCPAAACSQPTVTSSELS
ncbi:MAG: hypothetical protein ACR2H5_00965 [Ktedonobacteraceae bacterium]